MDRNGFRCWINQPSTLQPYNAFHGRCGIAVLCPDARYRFFFLQGAAVSMDVPLAALSRGWPDVREKRRQTKAQMDAFERDLRPLGRLYDIKDVDSGQYEISDGVSPECPTCGGMPIQLGAIGTVQAWRCRQCGSVFTHAEPTVATAPAAPRTIPLRHRP